MGEAAVVLILALTQILRIERAELGLVLVGVVQSLHSVVSVFAFFLAAYFLLSLSAHFVMVLEVAGRPPLVLRGVEIRAVLVIVLVRDGARLGLEEVEV